MRRAPPALPLTPTHALYAPTLSAHTHPNQAANKMLSDGSPPNAGGATQAAGSFCPGLEFAGEAVAVGTAVTNIGVGDRVYGFTRFGAYRTVVIQDAAYLRRVPDSWSYAEVAALVVTGLTAWHGLVELGNVKRGRRVLVHSAAGGVGTAAMQICTSLGAPPTGVVGAASKATWLQERFPEAEVLVRGPQRGYAAQLAALPGGGRFDCVLDSLGGQYFSAALESLDPMGRIIHFGATHSYGGARNGFFGLRKWLTLVPGYLSRPWVDPGQLTPSNRAAAGTAHDQGQGAAAGTALPMGCLRHSWLHSPEASAGLCRPRSRPRHRPLQATGQAVRGAGISSFSTPFDRQAACSAST